MSEQAADDLCLSCDRPLDVHCQSCGECNPIALPALDREALDNAVRGALESLWGEPTDPAMRRAVVADIRQRYAEAVR